MIFFALYFLVDRPAPTDMRNTLASKRGTAALLAAFCNLLSCLIVLLGARIRASPLPPACRRNTKLSPRRLKYDWVARSRMVLTPTSIAIRSPVIEGGNVAYLDFP